MLAALYRMDRTAGQPVALHLGVEQNALADLLVWDEDVVLPASASPVARLTTNACPAAASVELRLAVATCPQRSPQAAGLSRMLVGAPGPSLVDLRVVAWRRRALVSCDGLACLRFISLISRQSWRLNRRNFPKRW